jgi:hypothetical protein
LYIAQSVVEFRRKYPELRTAPADEEQSQTTNAG